MAEKPFTVDSIPTAGLPETVLMAAQSYVQCNLVKAGIYAGQAVMVNGDLQENVMSKPEAIHVNVTKAIQHAITQAAAKGNSPASIKVVEMDAEMIQSQKKADMEYIDYILSKY